MSHRTSSTSRDQLLTLSPCWCSGRGFGKTGDFVYRRFIHDLERILNNDVRVALIYGDADYICNWFGGEAVSLEVKYKDAKKFEKAGYAPFMVDGVQYGEVREVSLI